jgi:hypothetical protein
MVAPHDTSRCCGAAGGTSDRRVPSAAATFGKAVERQCESLPIFAVQRTSQADAAQRRLQHLDM